MWDFLENTDFSLEGVHADLLVMYESMVGLMSEANDWAKEHDFLLFPVARAQIYGAGGLPIGTPQFERFREADPYRQGVDRYSPVNPYPTVEKRSFVVDPQFYFQQYNLVEGVYPDLGAPSHGSSFDDRGCGWGSSYPRGTSKICS